MHQRLSSYFTQLVAGQAWSCIDRGSMFKAESASQEDGRGTSESTLTKRVLTFPPSYHHGDTLPLESAFQAPISTRSTSVDDAHSYC
jgi:hypothetical protein